MAMSDYKSEVFQPLVDRDGRYAREAYSFTLEAFEYTMQRRRAMGQLGHITGGQLCQGIKEYAESAFGYLTKTVFSQWGLRSTRDFGEIVFALIEAELLSKRESDRVEDFDRAFEFDEVFERQFIYD